MKAGMLERSDSISRIDSSQLHADAMKADRKFPESIQDVGDRPLSEYFWEDTLMTCYIGIPLIIGGASKMTQQMIISIMLGRDNTVLLAAITVSGIWTGWADAMVAAGAGQIGTLCGMAYGAGNFLLCGTWLQLGMVWLTIMYPPFALFRFVTGPMLEYFGVPAVTAIPAGTFTAWSSVAVIFELWYMAVHIYCVAQGIVIPDAVISIIFVGVAAALVYFFLYYLEMGVIGVAIALSVKRFLRLACLVVYCNWKGLWKKTWGGWDLKSVMVPDRWKVFLPMALPAMMGGVAETLHWSISALFAARLGPDKSASFDLCMTLYILVATSVGGVCGGIGVLMSRSLGEGRPKRAQEVVKVGCILTYGGLVMFSVAMYFIFPTYAEFASNDPLVIRQLKEAAFPLSLGMVLSGGGMLICEILVKQGRAYLVFTYMPLCNWFVGLPFGYFMSPIWGINGLLYGGTIAYGLAHLILCWYLYNSDWEDLAKQARIMAEVEKKET